MPTEIGKRYHVNWRGKPPHMLRTDYPVWYRFLDRYGQYFIALYYDCLLGGPELTADEQNDPIKRMWRYNTARRADAIAELASEVWIIEVADVPGLRAVGQLLTYQKLWSEDPKILKPEKLILVSETISADLAASCTTLGIQIYLM
ncbi:MAG: hypothetical protein PHI16_01510 [Methanocellales archaeon]|nr:hypothetical protein [Methanocellales archaeon]